MVNALDDPFLAGNCYPVPQAQQSDSFYLEMPASGGHVGFVSVNKKGEYWSEKRAVRFLNEGK